MKLTREDCDDILRMYSDKTRNIRTGNLAHLFKVSTATIRKVIDGKYKPKEGAALKFILEISLGNKAMQTGTNVINSIKDSLKGEESLPLEVGVGGVLWDINGNTVGKWKVVSQ